MSGRTYAESLVFTGGGTGGHFFPAVALAEGLRARWGGPIWFVGARRGIEARLLPASPWPHELLDVEGFAGRSPLRAARAAWKLARAWRTLVARWRRERPAAVIGTGGYGAAPALMAAQALGIPFFLHESNAAPGLLVKALAKRAAGVWCGMPEGAAALPGARCLVAGTPVREAFLRDFRPVAQLAPPFRLLVLGGSGGARAVNEAVMEAAPALLDRFPDWDILHQTGPAQHEALSARPRHPRHRLAPFLEFMDTQMEAASLVLTRSGASTCAELMASGRPALMVPLPGSAGDHQVANARAMEAGGRARVLLQGPDLARDLAAAAAPLMADPRALASLARPEANRAVDICLDDLAARTGIGLH
ncbi:UDP-N-acetylglucosamine--N-acetylmuramyl-(pentapeptide) pyrophosphoryl-undecaprenol N-acetylglucosamine transferase [Mesoterricola sediminis]|uniref:UDP-N-acetylglucosamine--N-acetylmuramyl-(pentapeptide) pyrophosphoryl-undecaprenol N-acetylglucosamine transferase n=1 Tax=Mesoterricola sediminis TaxID=2927980 RepID=A0AA48GUK9_9BACT|nr:UDP-N-acetylglucosamine--N-acetylmuramyl-(pentapeptide) pyrophosphoryl-undecaprenol N-acetylglucosamine transferase [Mesoterricola sediminis]BDU76514.1 UDP-N-acetylglucosamine--N-acetylmuramyl-(pentapeptide) pyrophosphoryl-undecaprenol N-acetylglucosamine transferase [Mesoterricola sediminis]